jgi:hypothetical protein
VNVVLEPYEAMCAGAVGFRRQFNAMLRRDRPRFPEAYPGQLWYNHISGACAEMAVAKALGLYWGGGVDTFNTEDLENTGFEVRYSPAGKPKVLPRDTRIIVAVVGDSPSITHFTILGWLRAADAKREQWRSHGEPTCFFPPRNAWQPLEQLRQMQMCKLEGEQ